MKSLPTIRAGLGGQGMVHYGGVRQGNGSGRALLLHEVSNLLHRDALFSNSASQTYAHGAIHCSLINLRRIRR